MPKKTFDVGFFTGPKKIGKSEEGLGDVLRRWSKLGYGDDGWPPVQEVGGFTRELKMLNEHSNGSIYGVFAKYRVDDIPHIGQIRGRREDAIPLKEDEGLIEKNHFIYVPEHQLLVFQTNGHANTHGTLARAISKALPRGQKISFVPVLQKESMRRLMDRNLAPVRLEVSFTRPTNKDLYDGEKWSDDLLDMIQISDGNTAHLTLGLGRNPVPGARLSDRVKNGLAALMASTDVSVARVDVREGDQVYPIDLVADRITGECAVDMLGRYPSQNDMFAGLERAIDDNFDAIIAIIGQGQSKIS